jgi:putative transcriptional regulator
MLKFTPENQKEPKRGSLLLAEPFLDDPYFKRTVIILCEHNEEGSFGFVLNNYVEVEIENIISHMPKFETRVSIGIPTCTTFIP